MTDFLKIAKSIVVHFAHICAYGVETVKGVGSYLNRVRAHISVHRCSLPSGKKNWLNISNSDLVEKSNDGQMQVSTNQNNSHSYWLHFLRM